MSETPPFDNSVTPDTSQVPLARTIQAEFPVAAPPPIRCEMLLYDLTPRSAWGDVGRLVLCILVLELFMGVVVQLAATAGYGLPADGIEMADPAIRRVLLFLNLGMRAVGWVAIAAWLNRRAGQGAAHLGLRRDGRFADVGLGLVTVVGIYGCVIAGFLALRVVWPGVLQEFERNAEELTDLLPKLAPYQFAGLSLAVGVYEEVIFRGFLMPRLRRAMGSWVAAVVMSSAVFTALHVFDQTPAAMLLIGFLSIVFSVVTILRRSILPAIVAHALFDFWQFYGLYVHMGDRWR